MDDDTFWALVARARAEGGDDSPETVSETLVSLLVQLTPAEVVEAGEAFDRISDRGYGFALWGAAYLLNGGCGDDGFDCFRGWLVTRGRAVYEAALADPDSLADVVTTDELGEVQCEDVLGAAWEAHQQLTGRDLPPSAGRAPRPELGEDFDFDDDAEMRRRYPRISALVDRADGSDLGDPADAGRTSRSSGPGGLGAALRRLLGRRPGGDDATR